MQMNNGFSIVKAVLALQVAADRGLVQYPLQLQNVRVSPE